jgi:hypothetical protein
VYLSLSLSMCVCVCEAHHLIVVLSSSCYGPPICASITLPTCTHLGCCVDCILREWHTQQCAAESFHHARRSRWRLQTLQKHTTLTYIQNGDEENAVIGYNENHYANSTSGRFQSVSQLLNNVCSRQVLVQS